MIFIVVKFPVKPEHAEQWPSLVAEFTAATRAEPGNLFFEWSRSLDEPDTYVLTEAFADDAAGGAHVGSAHFKAAIGWMPDYVAATPSIVNVTTEQAGWGPMGEVAPR